MNTAITIIKQTKQLHIKIGLYHYFQGITMFLNGQLYFEMANGPEIALRYISLLFGIITEHIIVWWGCVIEQQTISIVSPKKNFYMVFSTKQFYYENLYFVCFQFLNWNSALYWNYTCLCSLFPLSSFKIFFQNVLNSLYFRKNNKEKQ